MNLMSFSFRYELDELLYSSNHLIRTLTLNFLSNIFITNTDAISIGYYTPNAVVVIVVIIIVVVGQVPGHYITV